MLSTRTAIGTKCRKSFRRNVRSIMREKPKKKPPQSKLPPNKLPERTVVVNNPSKTSLNSVYYFCPYPHCREKLWLGHDKGRHIIKCDFCKGSFILNIK